MKDISGNKSIGPKILEMREFYLRQELRKQQVEVKPEDQHLYSPLFTT